MGRHFQRQIHGARPASWISGTSTSTACSPLCRRGSTPKSVPFCSSCCSMSSGRSAGRRGRDQRVWEIERAEFEAAGVCTSPEDDDHIHRPPPPPARRWSGRRWPRCKSSRRGARRRRSTGRARRRLVQVRLGFGATLNGIGRIEPAGHGGLTHGVGGHGYFPSGWVAGDAEAFLHRLLRFFDCLFRASTMSAAGIITAAISTCKELAMAVTSSPALRCVRTIPSSLPSRLNTGSPASRRRRVSTRGLRPWPGLCPTLPRTHIPASSPFRPRMMTGSSNGDPWRSRTD